MLSKASVTRASRYSANRTKDRFPAALRDRSAWIFDLDNTLYSADNELFSQIDLRMGKFISDLLNLDRKAAKRVQKDYFTRYGTTLAGLINHHGVDPEHFMNFVHDIDVSAIKPDSGLARALRRLPGRKYVFTNGSGGHARRILSRLGIESELAGIFDLSHSDYVPKPQMVAYTSLVARFSLKTEASVMIDDMARNLVPAAAMGMATVWLKTGNQWGELDYEASSIDLIIDSLGPWLRELTGEGEND